MATAERTIELLAVSRFEVNFSIRFPYQSLLFHRSTQ